MQRDIRDTPLYRETEALYRQFRRPGSGLIADAAEVSAHGNRAVFTGTLIDSANEAVSRICHTDLTSGDTRVLTFGPNTDRAPKLAPDGGAIAFLSDRRKAGDFQLYLLDADTGECRATPPVEGWVEYLQWSPDGRRILLGVAGHGADLAGRAGRRHDQDRRPGPAGLAADRRYRGRSLPLAASLGLRPARRIASARRVPRTAMSGRPPGAATRPSRPIVSPGPSEGLWYTARLVVIGTDRGASREIYVPQDQLGWPSGSPSGRHVAVVEALCSDRWIVAGDLRLIDTQSGAVRNDRDAAGSTSRIRSGAPTGICCSPGIADSRPSSRSTTRRRTSWRKSGAARRSRPAVSTPRSQASASRAIARWWARASSARPRSPSSAAASTKPSGPSIPAPRRRWPRWAASRR